MPYREDLERADAVDVHRCEDYDGHVGDVHLLTDAFEQQDYVFEVNFHLALDLFSIYNTSRLAFLR